MLDFVDFRVNVCESYFCGGAKGAVDSSVLFRVGQQVFLQVKYAYVVLSLRTAEDIAEEGVADRAPEPVVPPIALPRRILTDFYLPFIDFCSNHFGEVDSLDDLPVGDSDGIRDPVLRASSAGLGLNSSNSSHPP